MGDASFFADAPDDFDAPQPGLDFDETTGELLTPEPIMRLGVPGEPMPEVDEHGAAIAPVTIALLGTHVLDAAAFATELRAALNTRVDTLYGEAVAKRPARMSGDHVLPPTHAEVAGELQVLAEMHDTLDAVRAAFADADKSVRAIAGEVVAETLPEERVHSIETRGGSASARVGDRRGGSVKVTMTQPSDVSVDRDKLIEVLVMDTIDRAGKLTPARAEAFAAGAREGIAALLGVLASPKWKSTALDGMRQRLEAAQSPLAQRLDTAYGRKVTGSVSVKIEHADDEPAE